ncbi:Peptidoglycan-binding lysin domain containing protein, carbohydrate-Binding Module Family 50 protein [Pseudohyphozyma bogoriensis]|nr:Peptidoglycan-binding lysin domain containing protein, carbohydrate-Binding Module Family 50 protein [Pseudohyphozyma bogoriensis]
MLPSSSAPSRGVPPSRSFSPSASTHPLKSPRLGGAASSGAPPNPPLSVGTQLANATFHASNITPTASPNTSASLAGMGINGVALRSRKSVVALGAGAPPLSAGVDDEVTRPSLMRVTRERESSLNSVGSDYGGYKMKGKGRAKRDSGEFDDGGTRTPKESGEREVLVHDLVKTDTIASISLRYGITSYG